MNPPPIEETRLDGPGGIRLRPIRADELGLYASWWSDPEVTWGFCSPPRTEAELRDAWPELEQEARHTGHWLDFVLEVPTARGRRPVALVWLSRWDLDARECEMNILIGEPEWRRRGLATQAIPLLAGWAFQRMGLRRILLCPRTDHFPAIRCYQALGARSCGIRPEVEVWEGESVCFLEMELLPPGPGHGGDEVDVAKSLGEEDRLHPLQR